MNRKQIRLRKEYLYEREQEKVLEKRDKSEVQPEGMTDVVNKDCEYDTQEYTEPKILLTTSRSPSSRLKQFHKELLFLFPNCVSLNRGAYKMKDLWDLGLQQSFSDIVIVHEHRGEPDGLIISHLPVGPTVFFGLTNTVLRHDADGSKGTVSQAYPHLIFHNFNEDKIGRRFKKIIQCLFPVPTSDESKRVITFAVDRDFISVRHHNYSKPDYKTVELSEVGPRFEMRPYMIRLAGLLQANATIEWSLKAFINTAKKNQHISLSS